MADGGGCEGFGREGWFCLSRVRVEIFPRADGSADRVKSTHSDRRAGPNNSGAHVQLEAGKKRLSHGVIQ
jgi:hypothetical protein